tara:strand:- start:351 stop:764 length:414 start_codon:yes stop_codon:yes gene_type:complete
MFWGSIFIGIFLNGMNMLAYRFADLYLSNTLIYSALLMASNMCLLVLIMYYNRSGDFKTQLFFSFLLLSLLTIYLLREQVLIGDEQWLRRMISHHSTALTTSHKIKERTNNERIKKLASDIIDTQEREISLMRELLQ